MKLFLKIDNTDKRNAIENLCKDIGAESELLLYKDLPRTMLDIVSGGTGANMNTVSIPQLYSMPELIIFSGFDENSLNGFLKAYKAKGIEKVQLKAVITPYNLNWTLYDLIEHLKEEARNAGA